MGTALKDPQGGCILSTLSTNTNPAPFSATIMMVGTTALFVRARLERLLDAIEHEAIFAPTDWGLDERRSDPYATAGILGFLAERGERPMSQTEIFLRRKQRPRYRATLSLSREPRISFDIDPQLTVAQRAAMFDFADVLADQFQPDWGVAHLAYELRPQHRDTEPWQDADERDAELLYSAAWIAPVDYFVEGPRGLGMRTYIGPHFVEQLGRERVESLPLVVTKLSWGGYRVDLVAEPWKADVRMLLPLWRRGMAHLRDAKVLAEPRIADNTLDGYAKGERSVIGGVVAPQN